MRDRWSLLLREIRWALYYRPVRGATFNLDCSTKCRPERNASPSGLGLKSKTRQLHSFLVLPKAAIYSGLSENEVLESSFVLPLAFTQHIKLGILSTFTPQGSECQDPRTTNRKLWSLTWNGRPSNRKAVRYRPPFVLV